VLLGFSFSYNSASFSLERLTEIIRIRYLGVTLIYLDAPESVIEYTNCGDYLMKKGLFSDCNSFEHGGNIYRFAEELKIQERKVIDFSSSVNPLGVSKKVKAEIRKHLKYLHSYPDPEAKRLRKRLSQYHGIDPETILCGNGSTELIYLIVRTLNPQRVLIPVPTFSEYERACSINCKSQVTSHKLKEENNFDIDPDDFIKAMEGKLPNPPSPPFTRGGQGGLNNSPLITHHSSLSFDMAFLCNPNNPTGRLLKGEYVRKVADAAKELKCYLIVDEAFIDFCADDSVIKDVGKNPYLIVLRSMTAFYALSGLRLGYGVFPQHIIDRLKAYKEPWTVNNLSQRAAVAALKDKFYTSETLRLIKEEKRFFEKSFKKIGIEFFDSDTNFYLLKTSSAHEICRLLKIKGILVRNCANFRGLDSTYLRVAVKSHRENAILIKELTSILDKRNNEENKNR
jgi:threonine-phosphate decarboxylase